MGNSGQEVTAAGDDKSKPTIENPATHPSSSASPIIRRWKTEDWLKKGGLILRAAALVFSLLSYIVMASNKHGDWQNFDKYDEFRYVLAIAIFAVLYTGCQVFLGIHNLVTRKELISRRPASYLEFFGDQIVAYLLISAASAGAPITNRMRESVPPGADKAFTDALAASISMAFFAFAVLALSAFVSGKLLVRFIFSQSTFEWSYFSAQIKESGIEMEDVIFADIRYDLVSEILELWEPRKWFFDMSNNAEDDTISEHSNCYWVFLRRAKNPPLGVMATS